MAKTQVTKRASKATPCQKYMRVVVEAAQKFSLQMSLEDTKRRCALTMTLRKVIFLVSISVA